MNALDEDDLRALAERLTAVPGVVGVTLGGSRARGEHHDDSDVDRVRASWRAAEAGEVRFHAQVGHPLGVPGFAYAGEIALAKVLADPTGELGTLHEVTQAYPPALRGSLDAAEALVAEVRAACA